MNAIDRLLTDLRRPAGGWTVGFLTIAGALLVPVFGILGLIPGPDWVGLPLVAVLLTAHIVWGSAGYYPRTL